MNRAYLFEKIMTASEELDREPAEPPPPVTLADFVKEAGVDYLKSCGPGDINATWLERFSGTPLFESAKALAQQSLQRESEEASRESQLQEFKKQIGFQDWGARRAADEQISLQKSMLELELADLRNKEQIAALQGAPAEGAPAPTLGDVAGGLKTASAADGGFMSAMKGVVGKVRDTFTGNLFRDRVKKLEKAYDQQIQDQKRLALSEFPEHRQSATIAAAQAKETAKKLQDTQRRGRLAQGAAIGGTGLGLLGAGAGIHHALKEHDTDKLASEKLAGPLDAIKGLNWSGLQRSAGNIARSSIAPAAIGAGLGAVGGAITAGPGESALGGAAKGALGGAAVAGLGHAAARSGQALGVGKLMKGGAPAAGAALPAAPAPHVLPTSPGGGGELFPGLAPKSSGGGIPKPPPQLQLGGTVTPQMVASAPRQLQVGGVSPNLPVSQIPRNSSQMTELQMDGRIGGRVGGTAPVAVTGTKRGLLSGGTGRSLADNISYTGVEGAGQLRTS